MSKNEFNEIKITNDSQLRGIEFGKTSSNEFSFHSGNASNKNELNSTRVRNELNEGSSGSRKTTRSGNNLQEEELKNQLQSGSTSSSGGGGSSASSSSSSSSASVSEAAASTGAASGAAAASSAAVSASVVVVAAIAVTTAAPIIISQATAHLQYFETYDNQVFYEVQLNDVVEDEQYRAVLSNQTYLEYQDLEAGMNQGEFFDLEPDTEYKFVVEEGKTSGLKRELLKRVFKTNENTIPEEISEFKEFIFNKTADFENRTFAVQLFFVDDRNIFSDFTFTLSSTEDPSLSHTYELAKTTTGQVLSLDIEEENIHFDLEQEYKYSFSYKENGVEVNYKEETFTFTDNSTKKSEFRGGTVRSDADYAKNEFYVTLDYVDELNILNNFALVIYDAEKGETAAITYPLEKTLEEQTLSTLGPDNASTATSRRMSHALADQATPVIDFENHSYNYYFTYTENEESRQSENQEVTFSDVNERISVFRGATIDPTVDLGVMQLTLTLDFVDQLDYFSNFKLVIYNEEMTSEEARIYSLQPIAASQQVDIGGNEEEDLPPLDVQNGPFTYYVTYTRKGVAMQSEAQQIEFNITNSKPTLYSAYIDSKADFAKNEFYLYLSYEDQSNLLDDFVLHLSTNDSSQANQATKVYSLTKTMDKQTIAVNNDGDDNIFDLENMAYSYFVSYTNNGEAEQTEPTTIVFEDIEGRKTEFTGIEIGEANFDARTFDVTLNYVDSFNKFDNFTLDLQDSLGESLVSYTLEKTTETQTFEAYSTTNPDQVIDLEHNVKSYVLTYQNEGVTQTVNSPSNFKFYDTNGLESHIDLAFRLDGETPGTALMNFGTYEFEVVMDYVDFFNYYNGSFVLQLENDSGGTFIIEDIDPLQDVQILNARGAIEEGVDVASGEPITWSVICYREDETEVVASTGSVTFMESRKSEVNTVELGYINRDTDSSPDVEYWYVPFRIEYVDDFNRYSYFTVKISSKTNEQAVSTLVGYNDSTSIEMDTFWQTGYFSVSSDMVSDYTNGPVVVELSALVDNEEQTLYSEEVSLTFDGPDTPIIVYGMRLYDVMYQESDSSYALIRYSIAAGLTGEDFMTVRFVDSEGHNYDYEVEISQATTSSRIMFDPTEDAEFLALASEAASFEVYIIYQDADGHSITVQCYTSFYFQV